MQALEKTFDIVECLEASGPVKLSGIAERMDMARSTVHHHLADLERRGFVVNDDGTYRLTLRFLDIGERVRRRRQLFQTARSEIDELSQAVGRPVTITILEQNQAVVLYSRGEDPRIPVSLHPGQHLPLHATATGKAILGSLRESPRNELMAQIDLRAFTDNTITDIETLEAESQLVVNQGYAYAEEERWNGRCGIAVSFSPGQDGPMAAVEVSFTSDAVNAIDQDDLASDIHQSVSVIDIKSDYSQ